MLSSSFEHFINKFYLSTLVLPLFEGYFVWDDKSVPPKAESGRTASAQISGPGQHSKILSFVRNQRSSGHD